MAYVDGSVAAVPAANKETYRQHAAEAAPLFKEFGARRMVETWGDDVPDGQVTDFKRAVKAKDDEVVVFSWIEYPDRAARDAANQKMIDDPRMGDMDLPFDGMRMIFAGFEPIHEAGQAGQAGYVDGVLTPVPAANREAYLAFVRRFSDLVREHGATRTVDAWGDDVPDGKVTDYKGAVNTKEGEKIAYGWVEWPSKQVRDAAWEKLRSDPRMQQMDMPFDGQRMIFGGFSPILDVH